MLEQEILFDVVLPGFVQFGDVPKIARGHLKDTLSEIPVAFGRFPVEGLDGEMWIDFDWSQPVDRGLFVTSWMLKGQQPSDEEFQLGWGEMSDSRVPCRISWRGEEELPQSFAEIQVQVLFYKLFLAANISMPGCFNLYRSYIDPGPNRETRAIGDLAVDLFLAGWDYARKRSWPQLTRIPLKDCWDWTSGMGLGGYVGRSGVQKAAIAFLHVFSDGPLLPTTLIWLTHSIEALYDLPSQVIQKSMIERVFLTLGQPADSRVVKDLKHLYDVRSKFVHGDMPLEHPLGDKASLDSMVTGNEGDLLDALDTATTVVAATLQKLANEKWRGLQFEAGILAGVPV
jgi:hypothetical protein